MDKAALRVAMRTALGAVPAVQRAAEEDLVNAAIMATKQWQAATTVLLYRAKAPELSVTSLGNRAMATGKRLVLPRVEGPGQLSLRVVSTWADLEEGAFGIQEPRLSCPEVEPVAVDMAVIPGLAFGPSGQRLGQGGGFYDRLLPTLRCPRWGVGFDVQCDVDVPVEEHDAPVDRVWCQTAVLDGAGGGPA